MSYKQYSCVVMLSVLVSFTAFFALWHFYISELHAVGGDMSRTAGKKLTDSPYHSKPDYKVLHTEFTQYLEGTQDEQFDVITIGSSCSNGGGGAYYQDYLTDKYGLKIVNVQCGKFNPAQVFAVLAFKGYVQKMKPKYVILECVERYFPKIGADWNTNVIEADANYFMTYMQNIGAYSPKGDTAGFLPNIMVKACVMFLKDRIYSLTHPGSLSTAIREAVTDRELFTGQREANRLYYLTEDRNYLDKEFDMKSVNAAMNRISEFVAANDVKLVFMGIPNKYSLYLPYTTDSADIPENSSFTNLEALEQQYIFVNVKDILRKAFAAEQVQDLFWGNDTHWTYKAHKFVGDYIAKTLFPAK